MFADRGFEWGNAYNTDGGIPGFYLVKRGMELQIKDSRDIPSGPEIVAAME